MNWKNHYAPGILPDQPNDKERKLSSGDPSPLHGSLHPFSSFYQSLKTDLFDIGWLGAPLNQDLEEVL